MINSNLLRRKVARKPPWDKTKLVLSKKGKILKNSLQMARAERTGMKKVVFICEHGATGSFLARQFRQYIQEKGMNGRIMVGYCGIKLSKRLVRSDIKSADFIVPLPGLESKVEAAMGKLSAKGKLIKMTVDVLGKHDQLLSQIIGQN